MSTQSQLLRSLAMMIGAFVPAYGVFWLLWHIVGLSSFLSLLLALVVLVCIGFRLAEVLEVDGPPAQRPMATKKRRWQR